MFFEGLHIKNGYKSNSPIEINNRLVFLCESCIKFLIVELEIFHLIISLILYLFLSNTKPIKKGSRFWDDSISNYGSQNVNLAVKILKTNKLTI